VTVDSGQKLGRRDEQIFLSRAVQVPELATRGDPGYTTSG